MWITLSPCIWKLSQNKSCKQHRLGLDISKAVWIKVPWGRNSGRSGHLIRSTGAVAGLLHMTPTDNSLYCCDLQTPPYTSGSATTTRRLLKETCMQATFIDHHIHVEMLQLNYMLQTTSTKSYDQIESAYSAVPWASVEQSVMDLHSIHGLLMAFKLPFCWHLLLPRIWYIW